MTVKKEDVEKIYVQLGDDISRYIFANRLLYSLTDDVRYIRNTVCTKPIGKAVYEKMKTGGEIAVFGAGDIGRHLAAVYTDVNFVCFIDNKRAGQQFEGFPVLSLSDYQKKYPKGKIVISTKLYWKEIWEQLSESGYKEEDMINLGKEYITLNHLQYFDLPYLDERRAENEVFVDGGAYDGDTSLDFLSWNKKAGGQIFLWEPDEKNLEKCRKKLADYGTETQAVLIPKGLWSRKEQLKFSAAGTGGTIEENGDTTVEVDSIDACMECPATFIKMDIEGAEYQALLGAENMIRNHKPKLAICVYHKPEDIWEIPELILKMNPAYKFYLRHYSFADNETVLYAI